LFALVDPKVQTSNSDSRCHLTQDAFDLMDTSFQLMESPDPEQ
jgi:hypothetical protein